MRLPPRLENSNPTIWPRRVLRYCQPETDGDSPARLLIIVLYSRRRDAMSFSGGLISDSGSSRGIGCDAVFGGLSGADVSVGSSTLGGDASGPSGGISGIVGRVTGVERHAGTTRSTAAQNSAAILVD
jgi:hypothetical protein